MDKELTSVCRTVHPIQLIINMLLSGGHPLLSIHKGHNIFMYFTHSERLIDMSLLQTSISPIFQLCSFQISDHLAKLLAIAHESVYNLNLDNSSFKQIEQSGAMLEVLPTKNPPVLQW